MAEENEVTSTEETTEVADTTTTEDTTSSAENESAEDLEQLRKDAKAFKDQKIRAEKAESELKKLKGSQGQAAAQNSGHDFAALEQRTIRAELTANGVKDREEQDFVIGAAKRLGVDPAEALTDDVVTAKLEKMREVKNTKQATPSPTRGGSVGTNVTRLAEKALSTGELPTDPKLKAQVRDEMRRLSKK